MIQSNAYSYINVLDKALDASNLRETVITNNLANVNTPGYKRREVASKLNIPIGTVTWKNNEALKKLKQYLEKEARL